ncbi:PP2C family protein-serine/threonine phosphatase [Allokutzneria sp. NRRL B-24872]|uniref:PP2C family protein-serine/threonine phosphatase n=1 Tax=Allokutzneria sp. NRRL B-24872 TaxID=1137961 RepID=UPI000A3915EF|nr:fused response regulator/phosphatase [Allokutzneria sp. NRRL B-24872]
MPGPVRLGERDIRVLLVEDDDGDAFLVEEHLALQNERVRLDRVRTLADAEAEIAGRRVDCVLLDLQLPDATGLDGLRRLRAVDSAGSVAFIVLTGHDDQQQGVDAVATGAQDYLIKGDVDGRLLGRAIRYAIERLRAEETQRQLDEERLRGEENARLERGLLPSPLLRDPHTTFVARYRAGGAGMLVGGDFYDAVQTDDGTVHVVIGDVCGHGPDEAAVGVCLRIAWRALVLSGQPTEVILRTLQQVLLAERLRRGVFATIATISVSPDQQTATMHLAGHPEPLLLSGGRAVAVPREDAGMPLGIDPQASWLPMTVDLPQDWALVLYTDGLIEGRVGGGPERLGVEGLHGLVEERIAEDPRWRSAPHTLLDHLIERTEALHGQRLTDDVAVLLLTSNYRRPR